MNSSSISITNISENTCMRHELLAQHGQSFLINYNSNHYLFDVGEVYSGFIHNLNKILPTGIDAIKDIFISHRHLDHCGSFTGLVANLKNQHIYVLSDLGVEDLKPIDGEKYLYCDKSDSNQYNVSLGGQGLQNIRDYSSTITLDKPLEIEPGFWVTGPVGDKILEQAVIIDLKERGIVIIVGCSHPTLPALIKKGQEITGNNKVFGVIGGFHFKDSTPEDFEQYINYLKELNPTFIAPGHCTGSEAMQELKKRMPDIVKLSKTGSFGTGNSIDLYPDLKFRFV